MEVEIIPRIVLFVTMAGSGALLIWMARAAASGKLKRNSLAGIRTPSTMASDEAWLAAHVRSKGATLATGYVSVAIGVVSLVPMPPAALGIMVLVGAILMVIVMMWGTRVGTKAALAATEAAR
ncbi:SdpI family protein [Microbacterium sp. H37-C3]|uniref:SdpI family protein n=1 Tax=Microbacterium sp. H37-C3 TaxID=3004354 RepID=UPI0022B01F1F|nr:SdpI family protein [Microbacterium sp. H37-C3]MCZ4067813.1 SdpI family protein [Microbacterium sp. H37-C3]